jgi:NAD+ diphosphatase
MPLPFLPGHDAAGSPAGDDLLIAATVDGQVMVLPDGALPTVATLPDLALIHIGTLHGRPLWAGRLESSVSGAQVRSWLALTAELPAPVAGAVARGYYLVRWRHTHRHCGECGGELQDCPGFTTRRCGRSAARRCCWPASPPLSTPRPFGSIRARSRRGDGSAARSFAS